MPDVSNIGAVVKSGADYARDLFERVAVTFVEGFLGGLVITELSDKEMWLAAVAGGVASAGALLKGLVAKRVGQKNTASLHGSV